MLVTKKLKSHQLASINNTEGQCVCQGMYVSATSWSSQLWSGQPDGSGLIISDEQWAGWILKLSWTNIKSKSVTASATSGQQQAHQWFNLIKQSWWEWEWPPYWTRNFFEVSKVWALFLIYSDNASFSDNVGTMKDRKRCLQSKLCTFIGEIYLASRQYWWLIEDKT